MLNIKCPYCGDRSQKEFAYGGDGTITRPKLNQEISEEKVREENILNCGIILLDADNGLKLREIQLLMKFLELLNQRKNFDVTKF
jgi:hypothetical protein